MTYFTGSVGSVPDENRQAFLDHVAAVWRVLKTYGAKRMIETWGIDVPKGKVTDFYGAVGKPPTHVGRKWPMILQ